MKIPGGSTPLHYGQICLCARKVKKNLSAGKGECFTILIRLFFGKHLASAIKERQGISILNHRTITPITYLNSTNIVVVPLISIVCPCTVFKQHFFIYFVWFFRRDILAQLSKLRRLCVGCWCYRYWAPPISSARCSFSRVTTILVWEANAFDSHPS